MPDTQALIPGEARQYARRSQQPEWISPMLATLTDRRFSDPEWLYERKLDGIRALAFKQGSEVRMFTRNHNALNDAYPAIAQALAQQRSDFVVDGEIVAFEGDRTSFQGLQGRLAVRGPTAASGVAIAYCLFDVMHLDGYDLTEVPVRHRKEVLAKGLKYKDPLRYTEHRVKDGEAFYSEACRQGWEGLIAKRADSPYVQRRSPDWLKFKCSEQQELVIGGFTEPQGSRVGFGALLVGYYEDGQLHYAGKVGTGYDTRMLLDLRKQLDALETDESPFSMRVKEKGAHWVRPRLVGEVSFTEWTGDGKLRHPSFLGLREDKAPEEVVREHKQG